MHRHEGDQTSPLGFTGERVLPDDFEWAWCFQAHKFGYDDLLDRMPARARVLDIGCGEGYGPALLAGKAGFVIACDYAFDAVKHARDRYERQNLAWIVCDAQKLPFAEDAFDVVSSLQVIEHFRDTDPHLVGVARALRPAGFHYCATPNIDLMSEAERDNEFHLRDFTAPELRQALEEHFGAVELLGMFYRESSPRVAQMRDAERVEHEVGPKRARIERWLSKLPGPLRVRLRPFLRTAAGIPVLSADEARNAIIAEDFVARPPAEESFCLIAIARSPKR